MIEQTPTPVPLSYASRTPTDSRYSWLAIVSLIVAVLASPCLVAQLGIFGEVEIYIAMIIATILPVAAIVKIRMSNGTRKGTTMAVVALLIAMMWWGLAVLGHWIFRGWHGS